jgi:hypothetical protein
LNVPANGFGRDGTSFEHTPHGRSSVELGTPESAVVTSIDLAMNVKIFASIVLDRKGQKHS